MKMLLQMAVLGLAVQSFAADGFTTDPWGTARLDSDYQPSRVDSILFSQDFENGWDGWMGVDMTASDPQWHTSDFFAHDGNSWWSGNEDIGGYDNHWLQILETPAVAISGAAELSFMLQYATEAPGGEPAGYDGWDGCNLWISVDGADFEVATGLSVPYDVTSLYSFGDEFNMGPGIAGWADAADWQEVTMDLSGYAGSTVAFRFAFCSDGAYATADNPNIFGMQVDDILIVEGETTLLENDADGIATPSEFTPSTGGASGQTWTISDEDSHSPSHSANGAIADGLSNALVSPFFLLPAELDMWLEFWILCDMADFDGNNDNTLEDYYHVEVSTDGITWTTLFYDYGDATRPGGSGWQDYIPGLPFNGNVEMSLNAWAGEEIQLRWRLTTDWNDDGGTGTGLWIDDVEIWGSDVPGNDLACINILPAYPRTNGVETEVFVEYANLGSSDLTQVQAWMVVDDILDGPILPRMDIPALGFADRTYDWTPGNFGLTELKSYANNPDDQVPANDTLWAGPFDVMPAGMYQFGYNYGEVMSYWPSTAAGEGPGGLFTIGDEVDEPIMLTDVVCALYADVANANNTVTVHIYEDNDGTVGAELFSDDYTVMIDGGFYSEVTFSLGAGVPVDGNVWVWIELVDGYPFPLGDDMIWNGGHYFIGSMGDFDLGFSEGAQGNELAMWLLGETDTAVGQQIGAPQAFDLQPAFPNPFNPTTQLSFRAQAGDELSLVVYNLQGQEVATLFEGKATGFSQNATFDGSALSSGVYMARLSGDSQSSTQKLVLVK